MTEPNIEPNIKQWLEWKDEGEIILRGTWDLFRGDQIFELISSLSPEIEGSKIKRISKDSHITLNGSELKKLDTVGAMLLCDLLTKITNDNPKNLLSKISWIGFKSEHQQIFQLVVDRKSELGTKVEFTAPRFLARVGKFAIQAHTAIQSFLSFLGQTIFSLFQILKNPALLRMKELFVQLESVAILSVPIVSLVTFLIGVVVSYLLAMQIKKYGANIFVVDGISLAMCRELSPIIVAIIMAGRSGSAFTAQIGAMKLNEEIDALVALGLSPMHVLVLPRVLALTLAMPILVFVGDVIGILGGVFIGQVYLDVMPSTFFDRLQIVLTLKHILVGWVKAPIFAFLIALIGCRMGLTVENTARSVGIHTTSTVVQSIVMVIILNAAFAVILAELGI